MTHEIHPSPWTGVRQILVSLALTALPLFAASGCGAPINVQPLAPEDIAGIQAAGNYPHEKYMIVPDDALQIRYTFHPEMNQEAVVQPDGKITASLVGQIMVAGMTTEKLEELLVKKTSEQLRQPEVVVGISRFAERNVYIGGDVGKPGVVRYRKGLTPLQAIIAAGGLLDSARTDSIILVRMGDSGQDYVSRKLNLQEAITDGSKEPIFLAPHDVVYVPKTGIAEANLWVRQHITELFPFLFPSANSATGILRSVK
ncbi:MAG: polysaccharide biosynthesis/export family protein [Candidatus Binatia bacterium]